MLSIGPATKVTIYLNEDTGSVRDFLCDEILTALKENGVHGATVIHPYAGFGSHGRLHKADEGDVTGLHLPVIIFFVEAPEKAEAVLPVLLDMVVDGLIEAHPTTVLKSIVGKEKVVS